MNGLSVWMQCVCLCVCVCTYQSSGTGGGTEGGTTVMQGLRATLGRQGRPHPQGDWQLQGPRTEHR